MRTMQLFFTLMVSVSLLSCRTGGSKDSDLQHEFGNTRRDELKDLKPCEQKQDPLSLYLRDLALYIAQNNPQSFSGEKSIDKFCFEVDEERSMASAKVGQRRVSMSNRWLWLAENDAEVASIFVHEMAHVLLGHGPKGNTKEQEEEADEVGFEIFLRAQLSEASHREGIIRMLSTYDDDDGAARCQENINNGVIPDRGPDLHPGWCYRLYNINITEKQAHLQDYASLMEKAVLKEVPSLSGRLKSAHVLLIKKLGDRP